MLIAADTHVHVYPCYDAALVLRTALDRLSGYGAAVRVVALAERHDCTFFREVRAGRHVTGWEIEPCSEPEAVLARDREGDALYIIAGRQIVTRERIEVLALSTDADIADGQPAGQVLEQVRAAGGIPVLAWAPGKWFFGRGGLVKRLIKKGAPDTLAVGDTSLRPTLWPEPCLMRRAARKGMHVICGSDPLPFPGEETQAGRYASLWEAHFDRGRPVESFRRLLTGGEASPAVVGARCDARETLQRLKRNRAAKKSA
jgi:hypothetical protein